MGKAPSNGISLSKNGIIVQSKKRYTFSVTDAENNVVIIKNLSSKTVSFSAEIEDH